MDEIEKLRTLLETFRKKKDEYCELCKLRDTLPRVERELREAQEQIIKALERNDVAHSSNYGWQPRIIEFLAALTDTKNESRSQEEVD